MRTQRQRIITFATRLFAIALIMFSLLLTRSIHTLSAQGGTCSDTVKLALQTALRQCSNVGRNQACYGSETAQASPKPSAANFNFSKPGDTVPLTSLSSIQLSGYNSASGSLGVALLQVPGGVAGTNVGSSATVIVFGNTQVTDGSKPGEQPMQAFYLRNSAAAPGCEQVAADGILVQTPAGQQHVQLTANGIELSVGSTVFLSAQPDSVRFGRALFNIQTLQGKVTVHAAEGTKEVPAGAQTNVPLKEVNGEYEVDGEPTDLQALDKDLFDDLPLDALPEALDLTELEQTWETESHDIGNATEEPNASIEPTEENSHEDAQPTEAPPSNGDDTGSGDGN